MLLLKSQWWYSLLFMSRCVLMFTLEKYHNFSSIYLDSTLLSEPFVTGAGAFCQKDTSQVTESTTLYFFLSAVLQSRQSIPNQLWLLNSLTGKLFVEVILKHWGRSRWARTHSITWIYVNQFTVPSNSKTTMLHNNRNISQGKNDILRANTH